MAARLNGGRMRPPSRYVDIVQRRRDEVCFGVWLGGFLYSWEWHRAVHVEGVRHDVPVLALFGAGPGGAALVVAGWALLLAGVGLRFWAAGNLEKNLFTRPTGPYALMRHPLYAGTLLISLGFLLSLGEPVTGLFAWFVLVFAIFLPVLRKEERELAAAFPGAYKPYLASVAALVPRLMSVPSAVSSSRFTVARADANYGLRALWFLALVPLLNLAVVMRAGGIP